MEMDYIGKITKILIENNRRGRAVERIEIQGVLSIPRLELNSLLYKAQSFAGLLGLEIVGVCTGQTVPIDEAKKLFIRKLAYLNTPTDSSAVPTIENASSNSKVNNQYNNLDANNQCDKKAKIEGTMSLDKKRMFTVLSAIQLENNRLHEEKLREIQKCKYFLGIEINVFMASLKTTGFVLAVRENETVFWVLGWRFYAEYCDHFDIFEFFGDKKGGELTGNPRYVELENRSNEEKIIYL